MGDFNATILPSETAPFSPNSKENRNSPLFEEFLSRVNLKPVNTLFRKPRSKLISFYGPNKRKVTLDYILLSPKWIKSAIDFTTLSPLSVASDHKLLKLKFKWRLKNNVMAPSKRHSYAGLRVLPQFSDDIVNEANQRVTRHILQNYNFDPAIGLANYGNFSEAVRNSVRLNVPCLAPLRKRKPWITPELTQIRLDYSQSRIRYCSAKSEANKLSMGQLALRMSDMYNAQREEYLHSICTDIEALTGDNQAKLAWAAINKLTSRKSRSNGIVTAEDRIDRLKLWHAHFKTLLSPENPPTRSNLNIPKVFNNLPFRTGDFTDDELDTGLAALTCDKAAGVDEIVNEILRRPELSDCILTIMNVCCTSKTVPTEWHISAPTIAASLLCPLAPSSTIDCF